MKIKEAIEYKGISLGLYDRRSPERAIVAEKVIDITNLCINTEYQRQVLVKYCRDSIGMIAQINARYEKGNDLGTNIHWHATTVEDLTMRPEFQLRCRVLGIDTTDLARIIIENQPD